jgi:hypothetical protein
MAGKFNVTNGRSSVKRISMIMIGLFLALPSAAQKDNQEAAVQATIRAFYKAFDDGFVGPADYATEDWNHINPYGGRKGSRDATLKEVREVHQSFLKGVTDSIESMEAGQSSRLRIESYAWRYATQLVSLWFAQ